MGLTLKELAARTKRADSKAAASAGQQDAGQTAPPSFDDAVVARADRLLDDAAGKEIRRRRRVRDEENRYSAVKEAQVAASDLKETMSDKGSSGTKKVLAVFKFIGHLIHMLFRTFWRLLVGIAVVAVVCFVVGLVGVGYLFFSSSDELPNIEDYTQVAMPQDSTIYDVDGNVIGVVSTVSRESVGFGEISQPMKDAIVSIEDERFYNHQGVDFQGIARALYVDYQAWRSGGDPTAQGASTITQQYVRNAYEQVGSEQTMSRKLTEMMLAAQLEMNQSKDDILNSYLNTIYFGNGCYGVEAAAKHYFGHSASTLDYYEAAVLASIINAPSLYDPETEEGREETARRANLVIDKMYSLGKLGDMSQEDLRSLKSTDLNSKLNITEQDREINQPFYFDYVMSELGNDYSKDQIESGGWQIYTTLSIADGEKAAEVVRSVEEEYSNGITAAIVDIDNDTGAVHAMCGGLDYGQSQFNIATQGRLQTGSTLKPIVYAALCEYDGYYMSDPMSCAPVNVGSDDDPHIITPYLSGDTGTLKQGIIASDNAMAIHAAQELGMEKVQKMAKAVGIDTPLEDNVITVIGGQTEGIPPIEMASAYSTIARKGQMKHRWCVQSITDGLGNEVYEHEDKSEYAFSSEVAAQVTDSMVAAVDEAGWYNIPFDKKGWTIAAKTGTTNDDMDSWCCGFDQNRSVAIWVGGRDAKQTVPNSSYNTTGAFSSYFDKVAQGDIQKPFDPPQYKTEVPALQKGQTLEDYTAVVQQRQLTIDIEYVSTEGETDGRIVGVNNEGELVKRGRAAIVQVAKDMVEVPDFTALTPTEAYNRAEGLKITYNVSYSTSGTSTPTVTGQSLKSGDVVARGTEITLDVTMLLSNATEPEIRQVPVNATDSALSRLKKERDELKKQNEEMIQRLAHGETDDAAESVTIPNVSGLDAGSARQVLTSLGLKVDYSGRSSDIVTSSSPAAGETAKKGDTVSLTAKAETPSQNSNSNTGNSSGNSNSASSNSNSSDTSSNRNSGSNSNSSRQSNTSED